MIGKMNWQYFKLVTLWLGLSAVTCLAYLHPGFPYTHDGENHLARFANYKVAIRELQWPPRFAPNLWNHYGYPVFNYNYPLANILSLPFSVLKFNYELTFKLIAWGFVLAGISGAYWWLKSLGLKEQSARIGATVFALSPYLLSAIVFRGNIGEVMAMGLMPWLFYAITKLSATGSLQAADRLWAMVAMTLFLLAHNVAVLFGLPLLTIYAAVRFGRQFNLWRAYLSWLAVAVGATLWFWLPAIMEKNLIILDQADLSTNFAHHFPELSQLIFSPLGFGFSYQGSIDSLSFSLGLVQVLFLILGFLFFFKAQLWTKAKELTLTTLIILSLLLVVFQLSWSEPIWSALPLIKFIQFPWRLTMFFTILIVPLAGFLWQRLPSWTRVILALVLVWQTLVFLNVRPADYFHKTILDYDSFSQSTTTNNENLPTTWRYTEIGDWQPSPKLAKGEGQITVNFWTGSKRSYDLNLTTQAIVVEPTMFFPGWRTVALSPATGQETVFTAYQASLDQVLQGRLGYQLEPGYYKVKSQFTGAGVYRVIGNLVSLAALGYLAVLSLKVIGKKYQNETK